LGTQDDDDEDDDEDDDDEGARTAVIERNAQSNSNDDLPPLPDLGKLKIHNQTTPSTTTGPIPLKNYKFKAERICRLGMSINCAEFWGKFSFV
jgi:hypothetical protein